MMWKARFFAFAFVFIPSSIQAEAIAVRSGEHEGFTRLVVHMPRESVWKLETDELQALLVFDSDALEFDLSQIFSRIGRQRVSAVTTQKNGIRIDLACDCEIDAYNGTDQMVVVDVRPRPVAAKSEAMPEQFSVPADQLRTKKPIARRDFDFSSKNRDLASDIDISSQFQVHQAELRLARQLSRAASLGLLDVVRELPQTPETESIVAEQIGKSDRVVQLDAGTSVLKKLRPDFADDDFSIDGKICLSNGKIDTASWAQSADFLSGLADLRGKLAGEIEPLDPAAAINLAKHYLHFGFGTEALELLGNINADEEVDLLTTLAILIDESPIVPPKSLKDLATCEGSAGMWGFIAAPAGVPIRGLHGKSIVFSFTELPASLQSLLGPRLASAFLAQGLNEEAQLVLGTVKRQTVGPATGLDYSIAQGEIQQGNVKEAAKKLSDAVRIDDPMAPKALIKLINEEIDAGRPITVQTVELLASYAHQYRKSDLSRALNKTLMLAYARAGQFEDAWQLLQAREDSSVFDGDLDGFAHLLSVYGKNFEVLRYAALTADQLDQLSSKVALGISQRLYDMGFDELAESFRNAPETQNDLRTRRLTRAERAIAEGDFVAARAALIGMSGDEASRLKVVLQSAENLVQIGPDAPVPVSLGAVSLEEAQSQLVASQRARDRLEILLAETALGSNASE